MQAMYSFLRRHLRKIQTTPKHLENSNRFFKLPREIRDQIYHEVLCRRYLILWLALWKIGASKCNEYRPLFWFRGRHYHWMGLFWSGHVWMKKRPVWWTDIGLLLTSKAISQEAIEVMYAGSVFRVYAGQKSERWFRLTPLPSQPRLNRIQNLEVETCVCGTLDYTATESWFKVFDGRYTKRNICRISFPCYYCLIWCDDHTPFFRACQSLVGFKTVIVTLELLDVDADEEDEFLEKYTSMREDFQAALEPHLGPSCSYDVGHLLSLEFHPRKHLEDSQAAVPNSKPQALVWI